MCTTALLMLYYCFTTALLLQVFKVFREGLRIAKTCFTTALLLLYYCFTTALFATGVQGLQGGPAHSKDLLFYRFTIV